MIYITQRNSGNFAVLYTAFAIHDTTTLHITHLLYPATVIANKLNKQSSQYNKGLINHQTYLYHYTYS